MADTAAQREARRRKLAMNAEARMKKLLGNVNQSENDSNAAESIVTKNAETLPFNEHSSEKENHSPYNLRRRGKDSSPETNMMGAKTFPLDKENSHVPYTVVEDPEVPDLAEFLASQKAAKEKQLPPKILHSDKGRLTSTHVEAIKIGGCILTALLSKLSLKFGFGFLCQSIFIPFFLFEIFAGYIIYVYFKKIVEAIKHIVILRRNDDLPANKAAKGILEEDFTTLGQSPNIECNGGSFCKK